MDTPSTAVDVVYTPTLARSCWTPRLSAVAMRNGPIFPRTHAVYAEFESILQRIDDDEAMNTTHGVAAADGDDLAASGSFQEQLPCSFA